MYKVVIVRYNGTSGETPGFDLAPFKREVCFDLVEKADTGEYADVFEDTEED